MYVHLIHENEKNANEIVRIKYWAILIYVLWPVLLEQFTIFIDEMHLSVSLNRKLLDFLVCSYIYYQLTSVNSSLYPTPLLKAFWAKPSQIVALGHSHIPTQGLFICSLLWRIFRMSCLFCLKTHILCQIT